MLKLAAIGDCCVDIYPHSNQYVLGGTSYNLCLAAKTLGAYPSLVSAVGTDSWGQKYLASCRKNKIGTSFLTILPGKTSRVQINLDSQNRPIFHDWDLGILKSWLLSNAQLDFIAAQDIARCICLQPIIKIFKQFCRLKSRVFKVADFSGGTRYSPSLKTISRSFPFLDLVVTSQHYHDKKTLNLLQSLAQRHHKICLVTLGSRGSQVFTKDRAHFEPTVKTKVADTTGAGDAYLAAFVIHYWQTKNIPLSMRLATKAAAEAIAQPRRLSA